MMALKLDKKIRILITKNPGDMDWMNNISLFVKLINKVKRIALNRTTKMFQNTKIV